MNTSHVTRMFAAAILATLSVFAFNGSSQAASISSCRGSNASSVIACCEKLVQDKGRPYWMPPSLA